MENVLPYAVCLIAMIYQKDHSNQAACAVFAFFYSLSLIINEAFAYTTGIFVYSIISTPLFLLAIASLNKFTIMMAFLWLTEIILALIDLGGFTAYNLKVENLYQMRLTPERLVIALQLAALMVRDGRSVNCATIAYDLGRFLRGSGAYMAIVEKVNHRYSKTKTTG